MRITKQQILKAIDKANRTNSSFSCDHCWLSCLESILNIQDTPHPCSCVKKLINDQYHTGYKITPGACNVKTFPTVEILSKLSKRAVRI